MELHVVLPTLSPESPEAKRHYQGNATSATPQGQGAPVPPGILVLAAILGCVQPESKQNPFSALNNISGLEDVPEIFQELLEEFGDLQQIEEEIDEELNEAGGKMTAALRAKIQGQFAQMKTLEAKIQDQINSNPYLQDNPSAKKNLQEALNAIVHNTDKASKLFDKATEPKTKGKKTTYPFPGSNFFSHLKKFSKEFQNFQTIAENAKTDYDVQEDKANLNQYINELVQFEQQFQNNLKTNNITAIEQDCARLLAQIGDIENRLYNSTDLSSPAKKDLMKWLVQAKQETEEVGKVAANPNKYKIFGRDIGNGIVEQAGQNIAKALMGAKATLSNDPNPLALPTSTGPVTAETLVGMFNFIQDLAIKLEQNVRLGNTNLSNYAFATLQKYVTDFDVALQNVTSLAAVFVQNLTKNFRGLQQLIAKINVGLKYQGENGFRSEKQGDSQLEKVINQMLGSYIPNAAGVDGADETGSNNASALLEQELDANLNLANPQALQQDIQMLMHEVQVMQANIGSFELSAADQADLSSNLKRLEEDLQTFQVALQNDDFMAAIFKSSIMSDIEKYAQLTDLFAGNDFNRTPVQTSKDPTSQAQVHTQFKQIMQLQQNLEANIKKGNMDEIGAELQLYASDLAAFSYNLGLAQQMSGSLKGKIEAQLVQMQENANAALASFQKFGDLSLVDLSGFFGMFDGRDGYTCVPKAIKANDATAQNISENLQLSGDHANGTNNLMNISAAERRRQSQDLQKSLIAFQENLKSIVDKQIHDQTLQLVAGIGNANSDYDKLYATSQLDRIQQEQEERRLTGTATEEQESSTKLTVFHIVDGMQTRA